MPASNQRTPIQARKTESHIVDAPTISGVRVSPLPRRLPLLTNQTAQNGRAKLSACNALTPDDMTSGSGEKIRMSCSLKMYTSTPPMPSHARAQRNEMLHAFRAYLKDEGEEILDVQEGIEAMDRGEFVDFDDAIAEMKTLIAEAGAKRDKR